MPQIIMMSLNSHLLVLVDIFSLVDLLFVSVVNLFVLFVLHTQVDTHHHIFLVCMLYGVFSEYFFFLYIIMATMVLVM